MGNEQNEMLNAAVEPDDPEVGTVDESTPEATPEPVVEPVVEPTTEPVTKPEPTTPDPVEGQPEVKPDETPEDIEKSRAYHQQKSQAETEKRKQLETDLAEMTAQLQESDPSLSHVPFVEPEALEAPATRPPESEDDDDFSTESIASAAANKVIGVMDARDLAKVKKAREEAQAEVNRKYDIETKNVSVVLEQFATKHEVPQEVVMAGMEYAKRFVDLGRLGGPTKAGELAGEYIQRTMTGRAVKAQAELATAAAAEADQRKVTDAATVAQPAGGGISAPAPSTPESRNAQLADEIVADDPF